MKQPVSVTLDELHRRIADVVSERIRENRSAAIRFVLRYWYEREVRPVAEMEREIEEKGERE